MSSDIERLKTLFIGLDANDQDIFALWVSSYTQNKKQRCFYSPSDEKNEEKRQEEIELLLRTDGNQKHGEDIENVSFNLRHNNNNNNNNNNDDNNNNNNNCNTTRQGKREQTTTMLDAYVFTQTENAGVLSSVRERFNPVLSRDLSLCQWLHNHTGYANGIFFSSLIVYILNTIILYDKTLSLSIIQCCIGIITSIIGLTIVSAHIDRRLLKELLQTVEVYYVVGIFALYEIILNTAPEWHPHYQNVTIYWILNTISIVLLVLSMAGIVMVDCFVTLGRKAKIATLVALALFCAYTRILLAITPASWGGTVCLSIYAGCVERLPEMKTLINTLFFFLAKYIFLMTWYPKLFVLITQSVSCDCSKTTTTTTTATSATTLSAAVHPADILPVQE